MDLINYLKFHHRILYKEPPLATNRPEQQQFKRALETILKENQSFPIQITGYVYQTKPISGGSSFASYPALWNSCEIRAKSSAWDHNLASTFGEKTPTDQEVAVPISHEIAHCLLFEMAKDYGVFSALFFALAPTVSKEADDENEINANILGMMILAKAKTDPNVVIKFWEARIEDEKELNRKINEGLEIKSPFVPSHFKMENIRQLKLYLNSAQRIYQQSLNGHR